MINKDIKKYCYELNEQLKSSNIDYKLITQSYYELLKEKSHLNINEGIIKELKLYQELNTIRGNLEELFSKKNMLKKKDLIVSLSKISMQIIDAVTTNSMQEVYDIGVDVDIKESNEIIKEQIMEWDYFSKYFDSSFEYWQIKEAIGWIAGYIETEDYDPSKILVFEENNELNKKQTLKNILLDINKKSLTSKQPFITKVSDEQKKHSDFGFSFRPAGNGEIDVMLWSEKKQKAVALSVTRDRSYQVEGNQFIRHYVRMLSTALKIKSRYSKGDITKLEARNYVKSNSFREDNGIKEFGKLNKEIRWEIFQKVEGHDNKEHKVNNLFLRDLTYIRQQILGRGGMNFTNNMKINKSEMEAIINLGKENLTYTYFGEVLKTNDFMQQLTASLNSFAYVSNFNSVSNVNVGIDNSFKFLNEINFRYNSVKDDDLFKTGLEMTATILVMKTEQFHTIADGYQEGKVYSAERSNLFKSVGNLLSLIKDKNNVSEYLIEELGMESSLAEKVEKAIKSNYFLSDLRVKLEKIKVSQSELVQEREFALLLAENINQKEIIKSFLSKKSDDKKTMLNQSLNSTTRNKCK